MRALFASVGIVSSSPPGQVSEVKPPDVLRIQPARRECGGAAPRATQGTYAPMPSVFMKPQKPTKKGLQVADPKAQSTISPDTPPRGIWSKRYGYFASAGLSLKRLRAP